MRYVVHPEELINAAIRSGLLSPEEAHSPNVRSAAHEESADLADHWPAGEGFGSSDMTYLIQSFLEHAGFKTKFVNHRLSRV